MSGTVNLLIINPNSSQSVTDELSRVVVAPPGVKLKFLTAHPPAPLSINDVTTGVQSAAECFSFLQATKAIDQYDGFLVCCFSDHPLTHMLREITTKPAINILEASISQSLLIGQRFGVVTSGSGFKYVHYTEVRNFLGANSERFAGVVAAELGVLEFNEGEKDYVEKKVKKASAKVASQGADVIILGCAGMAGMEELVKEGVREAGHPPVRVVDGVKAGVQFLTGLVRLGT